MNDVTLDLVALHKLVDYPLKRLIGVDHVNDQHLLEDTVVVLKVIVKLVGTSTNSHEHIVLAKTARELLSTDEVHLLVLGVLHDWDSNIVSLNDVVDLVINLITLSRLELDGRDSEELVALLVDLLVSEPSFHNSLLPDSFVLFSDDVLSLHILALIELLLMIPI